MKQWKEVAEAKEIPEGDALVVRAGDREIALFYVEGQYFALDNICPHMGGPIGEGRVRGDLITCPWHDWSFEIRTGICTINPAARLESFPTQVREGKVFIEI